MCYFNCRVFCAKAQQKENVQMSHVNVSRCASAAAAAAIVVAATFRATPNNSHAQWCGNSEETNETAKMTYFTEAWCCCRRYSFNEYISCFFGRFFSSSTLTVPSMLMSLLSLSSSGFSAHKTE